MMDKKNSKYEIDMTTGSLMPKIITFFVPLMISNMLQLLFNAVDLVVVGNWAGNEALAAVGSTTALINVFTNLVIGISLGANVIAARYIACGDEEGTSETVHTSMTVALILGFVCMGIGLFFSRICLGWMNSPEEIIDLSTLYMKIYFAGMPFFALYNYGAAILRAAGDTRRPLYYLIFAGILNAVLNMILVICFHWDVAGVGLATVVSQMVSCYLVMRCLMKSQEIYRFEIRKMHINMPILRNIFSVGVPAGVQTTIINFSNVLLQSSVNSFGAIAMAGYTAATNLFGFLYMSGNAISQACMTFSSQNYAVGSFSRIKRTILDCILLECIVLLVMGGASYICSDTLIGIYTDSAAVIASGKEVLLYTTLTYFLCGIMDCLPGALRGLGKSSVPMVLSVIGTVGTRIVWIYGLFPKYHSLRFLFISYPVSWILTILMQGICLFFVLRSLYKQIQNSYNEIR